MEGRDVKTLLLLLAMILTCLFGCWAVYGVKRACEAHGGHMETGWGGRGWECR